jgi:hypothetical protein
MEHGPHVLAEQQPFGGGLGLLGDVKKWALRASQAERRAAMVSTLLQDSEVTSSHPHPHVLVTLSLCANLACRWWRLKPVLLLELGLRRASGSAQIQSFEATTPLSLESTTPSSNGVHTLDAIAKRVEIPILLLHACDCFHSIVLKIIM